jgi:polysaccharide biosynthesis transport protein
MAMVGQGYVDPMSMLSMWSGGSLDTRIIQSRAITTKAAQALNLIEKEFNLPTPATPFADLINNISQTVLSRKLINTTQTEQPKLTFANTQQASAFIQSALTVEIESMDGVMDLGFTSPNAQLSADALNVLAETYIEHKRSSKTDRVSEASAWLNMQMTEIKVDLKLAENALQDYRTEQGETTTRSLESSTEKRLAQLSESLQTAKENYARLAQRYGPRHPKMIEAESEIQRTKESLENGGGQAVSDREKEFELARLEKDVENARTLHDMFLRRYQEANVSTDTGLVDVEVIEAAVPTTSPIWANRSNTATWGFIGLIFGTLIVGLRFQFDNTFKSHHEIEQKLGLPVLSILPHIPDLERKAIEIEKLYLVDQGSVYAEAINRIRSSLQYTNAGEPATAIQLTSSLEGEGKSTLAFNLALAMARMGRKTLIIDCDMRRPRLHRLTGTNQNSGLSDLLQGNVKAREAVRSYPSAANFYIMTAGSPTEQPLELLSSKRFESLLKKLSQTFDHIIVDSPPALPIADALEIGRHMDAVLLVIEAEKTTTDIAKDALNLLSEAGIQPAGAILSKLGARSSAYYYP